MLYGIDLESVFVETLVLRRARRQSRLDRGGSL